MLKHMIDLEELSYKTTKQISQIPTDREGLTRFVMRKFLGCNHDIKKAMENTPENMAALMQIVKNSKPKVTDHGEYRVISGVKVIEAYDKDEDILYEEGKGFYW